MYKRFLILFLFTVTPVTQLVAMQNQPKKEEPLTFTLVSTNILDEELYQTLARPPKSGMAWKKREPLFLKALTDEKQLASADILCMQEFNSVTQAKAIKYLESNQYQGYAKPNLTAPSIWFNTKVFSAMSQSYYAFTTAGAQANGFALTVLTPKNKKLPILGIINAHLNNNTPAATTYDQFRLDQIQEILAQVNKPEAKEYNWIICGDFNTDRRTHLHIMQPFIQKGFVDAHADQKATAKSSQEKNPLKSIDYVWYKGADLQSISTVVFPLPTVFEEILLSHRPTDLHGTFFSDHAILKTRFKLVL